MGSRAAVPVVLQKSGDTKLQNCLSVILGVTLISLLAQLNFRLPWTPVPITGQTFGVTLIALLFGSRRAIAVLILYCVVGSLGAPVFAQGKSGLHLGPTSGYLLGMVVSSFVVGRLADRGWTSTYPKTLAAGFIGSALVFAFGLSVLSFFIPFHKLLIAGFLPFIPGDLIKTPTASLFGFALRKKVGAQS